ncbi:MAG: RrF2 family transcriptional regulator [Miltoncostaeaceae bacterium]
MRISAKVDYALRALAEIAAIESEGGGPVRREQICDAQGIPANFLENILRELKAAEIVTSVRGSKGGFLLGRPAADIALADVIRVLEGPLASVRGVRPDALDYTGPAEGLRDVWLAVRAGLRDMLDNITVADLANGKLPARVTRRAIPDPQS